MSIRAEPSYLPVLLRKVQAIVGNRATIDVHEGEHIMVTPSKDGGDVSDASSHIESLKDARWNEIIKWKATPNPIYVDFVHWWITSGEDYAFVESMKSPNVRVLQIRTQ